MSFPKRLGGLGIRMARKANTTLLGKLVWDMNHNTSKLWTQVFSKKYVKEARFMEVSNATVSSVWNSIIKAKAVLRDGFQIRVCDGRSSFWYEPWSHLGFLGSQVDFVNIQDTNVLVRDVFKDDKWCLQSLATMFPTHIKEAIGNMRLYSHSAIPNTYIWQDNEDGSYTTRAGFFLAYKAKSFESPYGLLGLDLESQSSWEFEVLLLAPLP